MEKPLNLKILKSLIIKLLYVKKYSLICKSFMWAKFDVCLVNLALY